MILKVKDENGHFKEVILKGTRGEKGEKGDRGEDGTVLQQKEIDDIKSSLNNKANIITPEQFGAKGDGVTDDTTSFQNMLLNSQNGNILLGKNKKYKLLNNINITLANNLHFDGNGSTLIFNSDSIGTNFNVGSSSHIIDVTLVTPIIIEQGLSTIDLSGNLISNVSIGDIAILTGDTVNGYTNAEIVEITNINGSVYTFASSLDTTFTIKSIRFYTASNNITIRNLNIETLSANARSMQFSYCKNIKVKNCNVKGNGSRVGFFINSSIGGIFENCTANGYYDNNLVDNRTGYGFDVNGNNFKVNNCRTVNCKHHLTVSTKSYKSHNIIFDNFTINANDSSCNIFWALADVHGNATDVHFVNGTVNVSKNFVINSKKYYDTAFGIRGKRCGIENCTIIVPSTLTNFYAVCFSEKAKSGNYFRNNRVIGGKAGVCILTSSYHLENDLYPTGRNICIENNIGLSSIEIGDLTNSIMENTTIRNNECYGLITFTCCSKNVVIDKNIINSEGVSGYHVDIRPHYKNIGEIKGENIVVSNNIVKHGPENGRLVDNNDIAPIFINSNTFHSTGTAQLYKNDTHGTLTLKANNVKFDGTTFTQV